MLRHVLLVRFHELWIGSRRIENKTTLISQATHGDCCHSVLDEPPYWYGETWFMHRSHAPSAHQNLHAREPEEDMNQRRREVHPSRVDREALSAWR